MHKFQHEIQNKFYEQKKEGIFAKYCKYQLLWFYGIKHEVSHATAQMTVTGHPLQWPEFDPRSGHVGSLVDKVALQWDFSLVLRENLPIFIPPTTPHSLINISLTLYSLHTDTVVRQPA
jgi:hypothetical protein